MSIELPSDQELRQQLDATDRRSLSPEARDRIVSALRTVETDAAAAPGIRTRQVLVRRLALAAVLVGLVSFGTLLRPRSVPPTGSSTTPAAHHVHLNANLFPRRHQMRVRGWTSETLVRADLRKETP